MRGAVNHMAVSVADLAKSEAAFFAPLLEYLGYTKVEDRGTMSLWWNAEAGSAFNLWAATIERQHEKGAPGFHHLAFGVESRAEVDEAHRIMRTAGATILDAPAEYDYTPGYYAAFFACPDGMKFEVVHMPPFADV